MAKLRSKYLQTRLIDNEELRTRFICGAFKAASPVTPACSYRSLLVAIPVGDPFCDFAADVEISLGHWEQFLRMKRAFAEGRVDLQVVRLWSAPDVGASARRTFERDEYGDVPTGIFGYVGTYCGLCIRRHATLDCVTVQIC